MSREGELSLNLFTPRQIYIDLVQERRVDSHFFEGNKIHQYWMGFADGRPDVGRGGNKSGMIYLKPNYGILIS